MIKKYIKKIIDIVLNCITKISVGRYIFSQIIEVSVNKQQIVKHETHEFKISVPNLLCKYRADTFSTKEPDTLEWLDSIPEGKVLWDIGANIGLYSIYAAKARNCEVYAFEPSVFNLEFLARNIYSNELHSKITIIPIALNEDSGFNYFKLTTTNWGGALSVFGKSFDQDGGTINDVFQYRLPGLTMDNAVELFKLPMPDYIKIDVDGIEHLILSGGDNVLKNVSSVLVEINDEFQDQSTISSRYLEKSGFSLYRKCDLGVPNQYNQWWHKNIAIE